MTSLTFFSMFKQCFMSPLNALYLQYTLSTYATLTCAHKYNQLFLILHKIH